MRRVARAGATLLVLLSVVVGAAVVAPPGASGATTTTAHGLGNARDLVVDPTTGRVYVSGGDGVAVFAADGSLLTTVPGIPGAGPMVLAGTSLWVIATTTPALARIDVTSSTLAELVPVTGPVSDSIATAGTGVFFVRPGLESYEIVRLDVVTHAVASFPSYGGVRVATIPGAADRLLAYNRLTPGIVAVVGATAPFATISSVNAGANANEIEVGPDGDTFWTASASGGVVERRISTGAVTDAVYPSDGHDRSLAYGSARGGMLAVWSDATDELFVSIRGTTTGLAAIPTTASVAGVGVSTDGTAAYYADQTALVRIGLESSITSVTPSSYVSGVPATIVAKGVGLGGTTSATVGGLPATVTSVSPTQVSVAFPVALAAGTRSLVLTGPLGTASAPVTVVANTGASVTGVVRVGGLAATGVAVRVSGGALSSPIDVLTDGMGRYLVSGLPLGSGYRFEVSRPVSATSGHVVDGLALVPNLVTTIDVDLRAAGTSPAFVAPITLPGQGGLNVFDVEATTGRVFASRDNDLLVLGRDGELVGRLLGVGTVRRVSSGNGVVYVSAATTDGIRILRVDPSSVRVTGSWLLGPQSNGEIALAGTRLFVLAGTGPSYEPGTYDLRTFDPVTGATAVVPAPRKYGGLREVQRDTSRLIGLNLSGTSILDVSGPTAVATGQIFLPLVTFVVADGPSNRMWTSAGTELDLTTLEPTGRTFAATGYPRVAAGAGVILIGSTVFRLDDPADATHLLTPGQFWVLAPSGDRAYGTIAGTNQLAVAADLTPHVTQAVAPVSTDGTTLALTGYSLLPTSAVAIDGSARPFTVVAQDRVDVTTGPLTAGPHQITVTTPWGTTAPRPFTALAVPFGSVGGVVRSTAGPIPGMVVMISPVDAPANVATAITGSDGTFSVPGLPVGAYKVISFDPKVIFGAPPSYVSEWYQASGPGTADFAAASSVTVVANTATALQPIVLGHTSPGSITGLVTNGSTPLANMVVAVFPVATPSLSATAVTGADGRFTVSGLAPGTYKVLTVDGATIFGRPATYVAEYYDNVAAASPNAFTTSSSVAVTASGARNLGTIVLAHT